MNDCCKENTKKIYTYNDEESAYKEDFYDLSVCTKCGLISKEFHNKRKNEILYISLTNSVVNVIK